MKGMVFTEFLELVDERFSLETTERLIERSHLPSGGIYTAVGTYDHREILSLVSNLSTLTGTPVPDLFKAFGRHLFHRFFVAFPDFFAGVTSSLAFLPRVQGYVHQEARKLYPDAEMPTFTCVMPEAGRMVMTYRSTRNLADLAEGLILGCIDHFGDALSVTREPGCADPLETCFRIMPTVKE